MKWVAAAFMGAGLITLSVQAQANFAESLEKSALRRMEASAGARAVGRAVYRRLPLEVEKTFLKEMYGQRVLKEDLLVYRYYSPLNPSHSTQLKRHESHGRS